MIPNVGIQPAKCRENRLKTRVVNGRSERMRVGAGGSFTWSAAIDGTALDRGRDGNVVGSLAVDRPFDRRALVLKRCGPATSGRTLVERADLEGGLIERERRKQDLKVKRLGRGSTAGRREDDAIDAIRLGQIGIRRARSV